MTRLRLNLTYSVETLMFFYYYIILVLRSKDMMSKVSMYAIHSRLKNFDVSVSFFSSYTE
jgi:hypothetical protein